MKKNISKFAIKSSSMLHSIKGGISGKDLPCAIDPGKIAKEALKLERIKLFEENKLLISN